MFRAKDKEKRKKERIANYGRIDGCKEERREKDRFKVNFGFWLNEQSLIEIKNILKTFTHNKTKQKTNVFNLIRITSVKSHFYLVFLFQQHLNSDCTIKTSFSYLNTFPALENQQSTFL